MITSPTMDIIRKNKTQPFNQSGTMNLLKQSLKMTKARINVVKQKM